MHAIWKGSINFGLVNIPINLYSGSEENRPNLRMLHKADLSPIRYVKVCRSDGKEVAYQDVVKGFEYQKNEFVALDDNDFEKANVRATHLIEIVEFITENEVDIRLYEKPYYLEPGKNADHAYSLLSEALVKSKKVGLAKFVLHNREHLGILKSVSGVLVLEMLRYSNEIRDIDEIKIRKNQLKRQEIEMAMALIKQLTRHFKPEKFQDTYSEELNTLIKNKIQGKKPKSHGKKPVNTKAKNLMLTLKESLKRARAKKQRKSTSRLKKAA